MEITLQEEVKKHDREIMHEKSKTVDKKVKTATVKQKVITKRSSKTKKITQVEHINSKYVKMVIEKRGKNKRKLIELELATKTPSPRGRRAKNTRLNSPKNVNVRRKILRRSPKKKAYRVSCAEDEECPYNYNLYLTSYNEETDKRYLGKDRDLFGVKCEQCNKKFCEKVEQDCIVPTINLPMYVCRERAKYQCTHSLCYTCYQVSFMAHSSKRATRKNNLNNQS